MSELQKTKGHWAKQQDAQQEKGKITCISSLSKNSKYMYDKLYNSFTCMYLATFAAQ